MKFFVPIIALALSSTVSAAECYSNGGSNRCVSPSSIGNFRVQFCRDFWRAGDTTKTYVDDTNGKSAIFSKTGTFPDEAACLFSTGDIINTCYGRKNGGSWSINAYRVDINFCP